MKRRHMWVVEVMEGGRDYYFPIYAFPTRAEARTAADDEKVWGGPFVRVVKYTPAPKRKRRR